MWFLSCFHKFLFHGHSGRNVLGSFLLQRGIRDEQNGYEWSIVYFDSFIFRIRKICKEYFWWGHLLNHSHTKDVAMINFIHTIIYIYKKRRTRTFNWYRNGAYQKNKKTKKQKNKKKQHDSWKTWPLFDWLKTLKLLRYLNRGGSQFFSVVDIGIVCVLKKKSEP